MSNLILASESFLRNEIMKKSRLAYRAMSPHIDEDKLNHLPVNDRVVALARQKCEVIAAECSDTIVVAADTLTADQNGTVFTKPNPNDDPIEQALRLSGQTIEVYTGCCFYEASLGYIATLSTATIQYQVFSRQNLERLAQSDNPQIRSGALGVYIDSPGFTLVERIEGSFTGAFGLPMEFVYHQLELVGYFDFKNAD